MDLISQYGSRVFSDDVMRQRLPADVYESLQRTNRLGLSLDESIAQTVATAMMNWALEQGATHYTHWFQPMTNITAGKHDSFLSPAGSGRAILEFSKKALVRGEPDASSFPSGGLRATFEARGYTAWDPTSPAFVRDGTLYIPTAFCSYTGEALDAKTPLLRSSQALSDEAVRFLNLIGTPAKRVIPTVGAEQEYFLVDRQMYENRLDLKICGRTLLGAKPPKGQELDDHYCGRIRLRVASFMKDLDEQLWSLGVPSKTKHNEAAPAQHELAPVFETLNIACDHNQLTMEVMRTVAKQHGLACLLHEKPFAGINGSGKHNNYSICTDEGVNLLDPGKNPEENLRFLLVLCAFIRAVDRYADLLRLSAASAGNDQRLGGYEAPPAVISIFLGDSLMGALNNLAQGGTAAKTVREIIHTGVTILPELKKDESDRNRTSPFAFTGNKFEFRMVGSSQSIAFSNVVLNTALAESFACFAERLEQAENEEKRHEEMVAIIRDTINLHGRVIFNGNNYTEAWVEEAARRGLPILQSSVDAIATLTDAKNVDLFQKFHVFSAVECKARQEISYENYVKVVSIEASTLLEMVSREVLPAVMHYTGEAARSYRAVYQALGEANSMLEHVKTLNKLTDEISSRLKRLQSSLEMSRSFDTFPAKAKFLCDVLLRDMESLRESCDAAEQIVDRSCWPMPTYNDLIHRV